MYILELFFFPQNIFNFHKIYIVHSLPPAITLQVLLVPLFLSLPFPCVCISLADPSIWSNPRSLCESFRNLGKSRVFGLDFCFLFLSCVGELLIGDCFYGCWVVRVCVGLRIWVRFPVKWAFFWGKFQRCFGVWQGSPRRRRWVLFFFWLISWIVVSFIFEFLSRIFECIFVFI